MQFSCTTIRQREPQLSPDGFTMMRSELYAAADFLGSLLYKSIVPHRLDVQQIQSFKHFFIRVAFEKYLGHWFPTRPLKGSAYRCIRINGKLDPIVEKSFSCMGLKEVEFRSLFPREVTVWVDPGEVSMRIGEAGSICQLYSDERATPSPIEDSGSQLPTKANCSSSTSPPSSPSPLKRHHSFSSDSSSSSISSTSPPPSPPSNYFPMMHSPSTSPVHQFNVQQLAMYLGGMNPVSNCKDALRMNALDSMTAERMFVAG